MPEAAGLKNRSVNRFYAPRLRGVETSGIKRNRSSPILQKHNRGSNTV